MKFEGKSAKIATATHRTAKSTKIYQIRTKIGPNSHRHASPGENQKE
jgi:hypothetical protein